MKLALLFRRRWLWLYVPVLGLAALCLWLAFNVWLPLPPKTFVMASGVANGGVANGNYMATVMRYRDVMEARGIRVETITTDTASAPLQRLLKGNDEVHAALALGMLAKPDMPNVSTLAAVERHPVWIFTRVQGITQLAQLKGLRVTTDLQGTPAWEVTQLLLQHAKLQPADVNLIFKPADIAVTDLIDGRSDALIMLASGDSDSVRRLTRTAGVQVVGIERIASFTTRETRLKPFVLPQGAIELRGDIPSRDLAMAASHLHLMVSNSMHPALKRALLDAANEIHEMPSFLQRQGEFPNVRDVDFTPSPVATAYINGDRPWLEQVLPFWWAQLVQLIALAIIPILAITLGLLFWIPSLFNWKINAMLQNFYGELKFLETDIDPVASQRPIEIKNLLLRLDDIEAKVTMLDLPNSYANRWYTLREHLARARAKLLDLRAR
jgi:hypothetical protein